MEVALLQVQPEREHRPAVHQVIIIIIITSFCRMLTIGNLHNFEDLWDFRGWAVQIHLEIKPSDPVEPSGITHILIDYNSKTLKANYTRASP